jgi:hypothetical protein
VVLVASRLLAAAGVLLSVLISTSARAEREFVAFDVEGYASGTILIVNSERRLYYVLGNGRALRYPIAIGRPDEMWTGKQVVTAKRENPTWVDPEDSDNVEEPGPKNPLGLRAMNLGWSLWRIHGTPHVSSIGRNVSNGCIRMHNDDVIDLFSRVHVGAPVFAVNALADPRPSHWARKIVDQVEARSLPPPATAKRARAGDRRIARQQSPLPVRKTAAADDDDDDDDD